MKRLRLSRVLPGLLLLGIPFQAVAVDEQSHPTTVGNRAAITELVFDGGTAGDPTTTSLPAGDMLCTVVFGVQKLKVIHNVDLGLHYENVAGRFVGSGPDVSCVSRGPFAFTSFFDVLEEKQKFISAFFDDRGITSSSSSSTSTSSSSSTTTTTTTTTTLVPALTSDEAASATVARPAQARTAAPKASHDTRRQRRSGKGGAAGDPLLELAACEFAAPADDLPAASDFSVEVFFAKDKDGNDVIPAPTAGVISVDCGTAPTTTTTTLPGASCGDPNDSGTFTATDALFVLRAAVGSLACSLAVCDVSGNNLIQASDALLLLRVAVGLLDPTAFACPA